MVEVRPFRAYHYDFARLSVPPERLVAPPYDVISEEMSREMRSEPLSICNVILGDRNDDYARAAETLRGWISDGTVVQEERECYYLYEQTFSMEGRLYQRNGIVALTRLEPFGRSIFPHEKTHPKAKEDRFRLLSAIRGQLEQVFLIYDDPEMELKPMLDRARQPENEILDFKEPDGVRHRIFRVCREPHVSAITDSLRDKRALVADGHHRYETALRFSELMDGQIGPGPHNYVMTTIINAHDQGLMLLPTHRLIRSLDERLVDSFEQRLSEKFEVERVDDRVAVAARLEGMEGCGLIGFWLVGKKVGLLASLKPEFCSSDPLDRSDVHVLHKLVLEEILGIDPGMQERNEKIEYVKSAEEAFSTTSKPGYQILCFLNPMSIPEVMEIAQSGRKLPHKSTYFYPKAWSGLLMYLLDPTKAE